MRKHHRRPPPNRARRARTDPQAMHDRVHATFAKDPGHLAPRIANVLSLSCDVAIIGAGTAGLAAERSARKVGARTLLVDDRFAGTTCVSVGCMPSKLLIAAASAAHAARRATLFGVYSSPLKIDGPAVMSRVQRERDAFVRNVKNELSRLPDGVMVRGAARFIDTNTLALSDGRRISAKAVVIATGAEPSVPKTFAAVRERVLTNESIFELADLPRSIGVVGAGPLGLELAQALARLGVEIVLFDHGDKLGGLPDGSPANSLREALNREFAFQVGVKLAAEPDGSALKLTWSGASLGASRFDYLLVAAGRSPRLKGLCLENTGLVLDEQGLPKVSEHTLQCGDAPIFIAGDAGHERPVLHEASATGTIAGHNAARCPEVTPSLRFTRLAITFTDPPAAIVGAVPKPNDKTIVTGVVDYANEGRAKIQAKTTGCIQIFAERETGRLSGAVMVGLGVDHTAHLIAWSIQLGCTATQTLEMPLYHPTAEEALKAALLEICNAVGAPR
jgi:dihydrolipoyl dehydrogenase